MPNTGTRGTRMSLGRRVAVTAMSVGLALCPAIISPNLATTALASGTITINPHSTNGSVSYEAYLIFTGTPDTNAANKLYNLAWRNDSGATKTAVLAAIREFNPSYADPSETSESAQKAAEEIASRIKDDTTNLISTNQGLIVSSNSFAKSLAAKLNAASVSPVKEIQPATSTSLTDDGYYLFLTKYSSLTDSDAPDPDKETGTAPIFTVVAGSNNVVVNEKTTTPTVTKNVLRESGTWGKSTDRGRDEEVEFRIVSTLPTNLATFETYRHTVADAIPDGLSPVSDSIVVKAYGSASDAANGTSSGNTGTVITTMGGVAAEFTASGGHNSLSMDIQDVHSLTLTGGMKPSPETVFVTYYKAKPNANMDHSSAGNLNAASLSYTRDPFNGGTGTTTSDGTKVYNYTLSLHKQDKANASRALGGAKFSLQLTDDDGTDANDGKYVQQDGSLGSAKYLFETSNTGDILIEGLDSGTYKLVEELTPTAPNGATYDPVADTTIVISGNADSESMQIATVSQQAAFDLTMTVNGSPDVVVAKTVDASGAGDTLGVEKAQGALHLVVRDTKRVMLPLTGQAGIVGLIVLAIVVAAVAVRLLMPGKRDEGDGETEE